MQALKLYKLDNGIYPTQQQGLQALVLLLYLQLYIVQQLSLLLEGPS